MVQKIIITIDGPSASGKGTIAQKLAKKLNFDYLDSGLIYRKVAFEVLNQQIDNNDKLAIINLIKNIPFELKNLENPELRTEIVGKTASIIAAIPEIRQELILLQQKASETATKGIIADGRDMGTVIFPKAQYKFFLTADINERAKRRYNQLQLLDNNVIFAEVLKELNDRDTRDASRNSAPLLPAPDAVVIDSTNLTIEQVVETIIAKIN